MFCKTFFTHDVDIVYVGIAPHFVKMIFVYLFNNFSEVLCLVSCVFCLVILA